MTLTENDLTTSDHQELSSTTEYQTIATYQVPAQRKIRFGQGDVNHPDSAGTLYLYIRSGEATPAEITGKIRIVATNYSATKVVPIWEGEEAELHGDLNDINKKLRAFESGPQIGEDSYLKVQIKPYSTHVGSGAGADNVGWADGTESLVRIPITVYE